MPTIVVIGAQWGDEGKGKIVDRVSEQADVVVRHSGGANAGHTLRIGGRTLVTHLVPSGVMHPRARCILGPGTVIDPALLLAEMDALTKLGLTVDSRLTVSDRAHVTLPFYTQIDRAANTGPRSIGTTGRGIGPTYSEKAARLGLRMRDIADMSRAADALAPIVEAWRYRARAAGTPEPSLDETLAWLRPLAPRLAPLLGDAPAEIHRAIRAGRTVVFEGAQGTLLDLDHGTYPFVTSSNTVAGSACTGAGIGPTEIDAVLGITKAYTTRVGNGPFATEIAGKEGDRLREAGNEYGSTTGRARRCGWLDLPALRYAARINGLTGIAVTKLDVLTGLPHLLVCEAYRVNGVETTELPIDDLDTATPVYRKVEAWTTPLGAARRIADLPTAARGYVEMISARSTSRYAWCRSARTATRRSRIGDVFSRAPRPGAE